MLFLLADLLNHVLPFALIRRQTFRASAETFLQQSKWQRKVRSTMPEKKKSNIDGQKAEKLWRWPEAKCE